MNTELKITPGQADYLVPVLRDRIAMLDDLATQPGYRSGPPNDEIVLEKKKLEDLIQSLSSY